MRVLRCWLRSELRQTHCEHERRALGSREGSDETTAQHVVFEAVVIAEEATYCWCCLWHGVLPQSFRPCFAQSPPSGASAGA